MNLELIDGSYKAKILKDSLSPSGARLTTMEITYPRIVHADFMTHRTKCLAGDSLIWLKDGSRIPIKEMVDIWRDPCWHLIGMNLIQKKTISNRNLISLDEESKQFITTKITDCVYSGMQELYELYLSDAISLKLTKQHKIYTQAGWKTLEDFDINLQHSDLLSVNGTLPALAFYDSNKGLIWKDILSIKALGKEETYDLEVSGPYHNFIANGIVVHNSKNSASSRARPIEKVIKEVLENTFVPFYWGKNQKGMQAEQELSISECESATKEWLEARDDMVRHAKNLLAIGVHKQLTNRLLEPFLYHTVICSATEWNNFFSLRAHVDSQPEICKIAKLMKTLYETNTELDLLEEYGGWHLPLINSVEFNLLSLEGFTIEDIKKISVGRCARVSYLTHYGVRDPQADINLCDGLLSDFHLSPFEHVARPMTELEAQTIYATKSAEKKARKSGQDLSSLSFAGNFCGWIQMRKEILHEEDRLRWVSQ